MSMEKRFQREITTGRITLPVSVILCILFWVVDFNSWEKVASLFIYATVSYILIELNTAFSLIRIRTTLYVCLYALIISIGFVFHPLRLINAVPLAFITALYQLFMTYEQKENAMPAFNVFLCISTGSLFFPQLLYFCLPFYIGIIRFRSFSVRTFFAGLFGILLPYWFLFGYAFISQQMDLFLHPLQSMVAFLPIDYTLLTAEQIVAGGIVTLMSVVSSIHYYTTSYQDKTRNRITYSFLILCEVFIYLFGLLQPQHFMPLLLMQLIICAILTSHFLVLSRTRFSLIFLIVTMVILFLWAFYNLWMHLFTF